MVVVQQCPKCELRFAIANQLLDHLTADHPEFRHDYTPLSERDGEVLGRKVAGLPESTGGTRLLLVANQTLGSPNLRAALAERADAGMGHVTVLAPRASGSFASVDNALAAVIPTGHGGDDQARNRLHDCLQHLAGLGVRANGKLTDSDPLAAVADVVGREAIDEIIVSTRARTVSHWWHQDLPTRIGRRAGRSVTVVVDEP